MQSGFALVLDVYKTHRVESVKEFAKSLNIKLIFVPACGTGDYQPLDRRIFGILKMHIRNDVIYQNDIRSGKDRFTVIKAALKRGWESISQKALESAWNIPFLEETILSNFSINFEDEEPKE